MFKSIRTVAVYVTDLARARRFYPEVLGFQVRVEVHPGLCFLAAPNGNIDVYLEAGMKPATTDHQTARLGFFLKTEGRASDAFARLKAAGVRLLQDAPEEVGDGILCFQFLDPDGNVLEACGGQ